MLLSLYIVEPRSATRKCSVGLKSVHNKNNYTVNVEACINKKKEYKTKRNECKLISMKSLPIAFCKP